MEAKANQCSREILHFKELDIHLHLQKSISSYTKFKGTASIKIMKKLFSLILPVVSALHIIVGRL